MKIYVLQKGVGDDRDVVGVFPSAGAAMAAHPGSWQKGTPLGYGSAFWFREEDAETSLPFDVEEFDLAGVLVPLALLDAVARWLPDTPNSAGVRQAVWDLVNAAREDEHREAQRRTMHG